MIYQTILLLTGLIIYGSWGIGGLCYLLVLTFLSFYAGQLIPGRKWVMPLCVTLIAAGLLATKVFSETILAPIGMSFLSLQAIAYLADIHQGRIVPETHLVRYSLFLTYLPHVFMGPIERYQVMGPALYENCKSDWNNISEGAVRAVWGVFKKLVVSSWAAIPVNTISSNPEMYQGTYALAAMLLYSVQLYADFSGGIDIVLGISQMLGISLSENFDVPFSSESVREFWQRWHITLGSWLRDYIYIPLGGNRRGILRRVGNVIITFLVSGLWHGPRYLLWGVLNGIFVSVGEKLRTRWKWLNRALTCLIISLLWAFFIWPDNGTAIQMMLSVFTCVNIVPFLNNIWSLGLTPGEMLVLAGSVVLLWTVNRYREAIRQFYRHAAPAMRLTVICSISFLILIFGVYGIGFNAQAFIYSRF